MGRTQSCSRPLLKWTTPFRLTCTSFPFNLDHYSKGVCRFCFFFLIPSTHCRWELKSVPFFFSAGCTWCPVQGAQKSAAGFPPLRSREMNYFNEIVLLWASMISQALTVCQCHQAVARWFPGMEIWPPWNELLFLTFLGLQQPCQYLPLYTEEWTLEARFPPISLVVVCLCRWSHWKGGWRSCTTWWMPIPSTILSTLSCW